MRIAIVKFQFSSETDTEPAVDLLVKALLSRLADDCELVIYTIQSPDQVAVELCRLIDDEHCLLVTTVGCIEPADTVPEATRSVCQKLLPGFGEQIRRIAQTINPVGMLQNPVAGIRNQSVIVNLPAESAYMAACLPSLFPAMPNAVFLASGVRIGRR